MSADPHAAASKLRMGLYLPRDPEDHRDEGYYWIRFGASASEPEVAKWVAPETHRKWYVIGEDCTYPDSSDIFVLSSRLTPPD